MSYLSIVMCTGQLLFQCNDLDYGQKLHFYEVEIKTEGHVHAPLPPGSDAYQVECFIAYASSRFSIL